jgi:hypothetical protein
MMMMQSQQQHQHVAFYSYQSKDGSSKRNFMVDKNGNYLMPPLMNELIAKEIQQAGEVKEGKYLTGYGSVHEYHDRFKFILKRYLLMKYTQKKDNID